jgi:hypothetical protein
MFVRYGPIGDGPEWRAVRGHVSQDFKTSALCYAGALRLAGNNKGKLRRARFPAPKLDASAPGDVGPGEIADPKAYEAAKAGGRIAERPAWSGMSAKALAKAIKAGDMDDHLDAIEAGETRKSVLSAIAGRR